MSTKAETIKEFNLFMDDTSELSSAEESALYEKHYRKVSREKSWEGTKTGFVGTTDSPNSIPLPDDFAMFTPNNGYADQSEHADKSRIFVGTELTEFYIVNFEERRKYRTQTNVAYLDTKNSRLYFTSNVGASVVVEFDYHSIPDSLADDESPWFHEDFHPAIYHGMCSDSFVIQQSEKARSYRKEHMDSYKDYIDSMSYWNSQFVQI